MIECPIRNVPYGACFDCKYTEQIGTCDYPTPVDDLIREVKRRPRAVPLWMGALKKWSTEVHLDGRRWCDLNGNEVFIIQPSLQGVSAREKKKEEKTDDQ